MGGCDGVFCLLVNNAQFAPVVILKGDHFLEDFKLFWEMHMYFEKSLESVHQSETFILDIYAAVILHTYS